MFHNNIEKSFCPPTPYCTPQYKAIEATIEWLLYHVADLEGYMAKKVASTGLEAVDLIEAIDNGGAGTTAERASSEELLRSRLSLGGSTQVWR